MISVSFIPVVSVIIVPFLKKFLLLFRKSTTNLGYIDSIIKSAFLNNSLPVVHPFFMIFAFSAFFKVSKSTSTPNTFSYPAFLML